MDGLAGGGPDATIGQLWSNIRYSVISDTVNCYRSRISCVLLAKGHLIYTFNTV